MSELNALENIPYAKTLGIEIEERGKERFFRLPYQEHHIGNYMIQAIHGGVLCSFLEIVASLRAKEEIQSDKMPKIINVSYNFLKPALKGNNLYAKAEIIKSGRRILSVSATAYNDIEGDALTLLHANFLAKE